MPTLLSDTKGISSTLRALKSLSKKPIARKGKQAVESLQAAAIFDRLFMGFGLVVSLLIAVAYITDLDRRHLWPVALAIVVAALRPTLALAAFIFILPLLGNRPTTEQFHLLLMISAALNTTLAIKRMWSERKNKSREIQKAVFGHPLMLMVLLYFLASLASLTSLPWKQLLLEFQSAGGIRLTILPAQIRTFLNANETSFAYSILTVLLTQQAILIAFFVHDYVQRASRYAVIFCIAILAGLTLTLFAGLLDFYRLINLEALRPLDPNINPGGIQVRLQSFLGHSGWLAEYIVLAIPYALILLLKGRSRLRLSLLVLILMLGTWAAVLTYQRGGWITYSITLLLICISLFWIEGSRDAAHRVKLIKRSSLKALATFALIVVVPLATIYVIGKTGGGGQGSVGGVEQYAGRALEIKNVWERTVFFRAGYRLGLLHPFLGGGSEGFDFLYRREFLDPQGKYFNDPIPLGTLYSTAHNVYMQTFSGKGLWGLIFLLLPVIYLIASGLGLLKEPGAITDQQRLIILISICASCAFLVYGNMQEFFYIQSLQYLFFITLAIFSATLSTHLSLDAKRAKFLWIFLAVGLIAHLGWEYGFPGQARRMWQGRPEYGCYQTEEDAVIGRFNWCGQSFRQKFPVSNLEGEPTALLSIGLTNPRPNPPPVNIRVELAAQEVARYQLQPNARYFLPIVIPKALRSLVQDETVALKVMSDNLFNPAYDIAGSKDYRFLSIMKFAAPSAATQDFRPCGPLEVWENGKGHWCTQNNLLAIPLKDDGPTQLKFSIRVAHADAAASPVTVTLGQFENTYHQYTLSDQEWMAIELPVNARLLGRDDAGRPFLKLYVNTSRLWNPKKAGASSDDRDLGVAILLPD